MTRHSRIDTTASAIITDADAFPPESTTPSKDDQRQGIYPLRIYEGYNYLPTAYGYKSYFGIQSELTATGLAGPVGEQFVVEDVFVYQTRSFINVLIALTSHGIFMRAASDWVQLVTLVAPPVDTSLPWTKETITQLLFIYRQGHSTVFVIDDIIDGVGVGMDAFNGKAVQPTRVDTAVGQPIQIYEFPPTILNMAGQIGLFRAGGSLGFWDSDDSISWSAINDFTDFEPSLTTLANTTKLQDQIGAITTIRPHGDGWLVYCTRSVIHALEDNSALLRYRTQSVLGNVGVAYPREVTVAEPDITHYAFTSAGLMEITNGQAQPIVPDFSDYIKAMRLPQYLTMLNNRYLCVQVMDSNFIEGNIEYSTGTVDPWDYKYPGSEVGGINIPGYIIPGDEVCFTIPVDDPPLEEILDDGIKPYHLLQFYGQWQYKGATIDFRSEEIDGEPIQLATITEGSTDARYDVVPVKLKASEVANFNSTVQTDKLVERQIDLYLDHYDADTLKLQEKWDEYQTASTDLATKPLYTIVGLESISFSGNTGIGEPTLPAHEARALPFMGYGSDGSDGGCIVTGNGDIFLAPNSQTRVADFLSLSSLVDNMEDYAVWRDWLIFDDTGTQPDLLYYKWVGNQTTTALVDSGFPPPPATYNREFVFTKSEIVYQRIDNPEYTIGFTESYVLDPLTFDQLQAYSVDGAKNAIKVASPSAMALKVSDRTLDDDHRLVRRIPSSVEVTITHTPDSGADSDIRHTASGDFTYRTSTGSLVEGTASGSAIILGGDYQLSPHTGVATSAPEQGAVLANDALNAAWSIISDEATTARLAEADSLYDGLKSSAVAEVQEDYSAQKAAIEADGGTIETPLGSIASTSVPPSQKALWGVGGGPTYLYNPTWPVLVLAERGFIEEEEDLTEKLFGKVPATLPPTDVGAAAINAMDEPTKRGLIAVHQHYYNRNNSTVKPDDSFLILAAGREDVPLGAAIGSVQSVIDAADFANRYFLLDYVGVPPVDETTGASFAVPGQTEAQSLSSQQRVVCGITDDIVVDEYVRDPIVYPPWEIEVPTLTWVLQNGSRAPFNPTLHGAFVFDLHLQKWGVFKGDYKHLIDYQPVNNYTPGAVSYRNFMIDGGCLTPELEVALFTDYPADSMMRYGKYQHLGSEFCAIEQVHAEFKEKSSGLITVQFSLDGRRLEYGHSVAKWYNEALSTILNCDIVGQWATITFTGHFDLAGLRVKSNPSGRR